MLSYKKYNDYYDGNKFEYIKYVLKNIKDYFKRDLPHTIYSIYLCLRFPFLYPRNRWSGRHYTNWKIMDKRKDIYCKWNDYAKSHPSKYWNKFGWDAFFKKEFNMDSNDVFEGNFVLVEYVMKLATRKDKFLYWLYGFYHNILELVHCIPTYNELDLFEGDAGKGWVKAFGIDFCKDLKYALIKDGGWKYMIKDFRITQMKEKYGEFECYVNYYTPKVKNIINMYKKKSQHVCIDCGAKATKKSMGYICPYCNDCFDKHNYLQFKYINPKTYEELKHNEEVDEIIDMC